MSPVLLTAREPKASVHRLSTPVFLGDGATTTVHVVRYDRSSFRPRVVRFEQETYLVDWCKEQNIDEALVGGFFLRETDDILGDLWINGERHTTVPISSPWHTVRGSMHIKADGSLSLGPRHVFPDEPRGDLLQAGPLLVHKGEHQLADGKDREGVSENSHQFDSDITIGRYPRAAIACDADYLWSVVCDGRSQADAGLTLEELGDIVLALGAADALNLDGGGSAVQVSGGEMRNTSRGDNKVYPKGRPIYSAIVFN